MNKSICNLKVVLISNNNYGDGLPKLEGANYITEKLYDYFCYVVNDRINDIIFMKDIRHSDATKRLYEFIMNEVGEKDIFLFYFCGHGKISPNNSSELILAMQDTCKETFDSIGIQLNNLIRKVKMKKNSGFICILDCCHSGVVINNAEKENLINCDFINNETVFISSVKGTLSSYEEKFENKKMPVFSYYLWKSFIQECDSDEKWFSIAEIFNKAKSHMVGDGIDKIEPQIACTNSLCSEKIFPAFSNRNSKDNLLDVIDWRITSECNCKCGMCYACNDKNQVENLSENQIDIIIDKICQLNCKSICISGGEPTKFDYFEYIVRKLYEKGFSIFLSTNGYKYMDYRSEIEKCIVKLSLPLDGYDIESNCKNGRDENSFNYVKNILEYYKNRDCSFPIKISTVLTRETNNIDHLSGILTFLKGYKISIWKIYEFIPENRGARNDRKYETSTGLREVHSWIKRKKSDCDFKIELVERKERNAAYFIIQANGDVIIPLEDDRSKTVIDKKVGNIIFDDNSTIIRKWNSFVDTDNYYNNVKLRKIKQIYWLKPLTKKILYNILSKDTIPSSEELSNELCVDKETIEDEIYSLYEHRIIKKIIPIINLKMFGISTYLATLEFVKYVSYPEGYIESYLCYNAHIGWVTKCENNTYRIAIFANEKKEVINILQNIRDDLNKEVQYEIYDLKCSYAIREKNLFLDEQSILINPDMYNSNEVKISDTVKLSYDEFYALKQIEDLRKPLKENIDKKAFLNNFIRISNSITTLKEKGIIEQISISLDTRLLGYDWYIVFVQVSNDKINDLIEFLRSSFSNITHINSFIPNNSNMNLDFEVHTLSFAEVNKVIQIITQKFGDIVTGKLKIIRECKFSFLPHSVSDIIMKKYTKGN